MSIHSKIRAKLSFSEKKLFFSLSTPQKIQDFLDSLPINLEEDKETYRSPREMIKVGKAHCFEGALFALACLFYNGKKAWLLDLKVKSTKKDADHVVTLFKSGGLWGAISKTNHAVLRWRDPIYRSVRELAASYFHEYFLDDGRKSLSSYSLKFDVVKKLGTGWIFSKKDMDDMAEALDKSKHIDFYPKFQSRLLRKASKLEIQAADIREWV